MSQEAKRREAGRKRKLNMDMDRMLKNLEKDAMISVPPHARKKGWKPRITFRNLSERAKRWK
jgi:hypothetical protein